MPGSPGHGEHHPASGGSVGTSLLNTLAASAVTAYALANHATATSVATLQAQATVHFYYGHHIVIGTRYPHPI
jgi:hypothetical protein